MEEVGKTLYEFTYFRVEIVDHTYGEGLEPRLSYAIVNRETGVREKLTLSQAEAYYMGLYEDNVLRKMHDRQERIERSGNSITSAAAFHDLEAEQRREMQQQGLLVPGHMAAQQGPKGRH